MCATRFAFTGTTTPHAEHGTPTSRYVRFGANDRATADAAADCNRRPRSANASSPYIPFHRSRRVFGDIPIRAAAALNGSPDSHAAARSASVAFDAGRPIRDPYRVPGSLVPNVAGVNLPDGSQGRRPHRHPPPGENADGDDFLPGRQTAPQVECDYEVE